MLNCIDKYIAQEKDIEQMFRRHYEKMYNLARYILSDDDESKDVVSEVFTQKSTLRYNGRVIDERGNAAEYAT